MVDIEQLSLNSHKVQNSIFIKYVFVQIPLGGATWMRENHNMHHFTTQIPEMFVYIYWQHYCHSRYSRQQGTRRKCAKTGTVFQFSSRAQDGRLVQKKWLPQQLGCRWKCSWSWISSENHYENHKENHNVNHLNEYPKLYS